MIQRALATLLCLLGAAAIGLGVASATLWRADDVLVARAQAEPGTTMIVTEPGVLDLAADEVTITADADRGRVVVALGRTADVEAWVGGDAHTRVTGLAEWHVLAVQEEEAEPTPEPSESPTAEPTETPAPTATATTPVEGEEPAEEPAEDPADTAPDPSGSDLWVDEALGSGQVSLDWAAQDGRWSVLVAATGVGADPPELTLAWPQTVTTPWLWPGVVVGSVLLLTGMAWWVLIVVATRRASAAAAAPEVEPVPEPVGAGAAPAGPLTRRQLRELEEQRARQPQRERPGTTPGIASRFPVLVPGPRRTVTEPEGETGESAAPGGTPTGATAAGGGSDPTGSRRSRRDLRAGGPTSDPVSGPPAAGSAGAAPAPAWQIPGDPTGVAGPGTSGPGRSGATPAAPTAQPTAEPPAESPAGPGRSGLTDIGAGAREAVRRLRRAARPGGETPPVEPAAPTPPVVTPPVVTPPVAAPATPTASADAWRRAWGLPAVDRTADDAPSTAPPTAAEPPAEPPAPQGPTLRRRRDAR